MTKYHKMASELRTLAVNHCFDDEDGTLLVETADALDFLDALTSTPEAKDLPLGRADVLRQAEHMVCGHREQDYGSPEDSFNLIAKLWAAYLGMNDITPVDVSMMMALLKIARIGGGRATADSFIDLAGYAACGGEIATRKEEKG